ncbi:surface lipoprotein assembly modifier [Ursidibacter arcticus]
MKKYLTLTLFPLIAYANPELEIKPAEPSLPTQQAVISTENFAKSEEITLTQELIHNGELTRQMLNKAIDTRQFHLLPELVRIYQQTAEPDTILLDYAQGIILAQQGEYKSAIALYRNIIAQYPSFQPVRFRLAQMLFEDRQNEAALDQFRKLQAETLPPQIANTIEQYISAIQQRSDWSFNFGLNYLHESNVNNASAARYIRVGNVPFEKTADSLPQKANGVSYHVNVAKDWNLITSHYLRVENNFQGKSYWDNHQFDDQQNRTSFGYQYQTATSRLNLLPFYEMRWYGNHRYHNGYGIRAETENWLTPKWQLSTAGEIGKIRHSQTENQRADSLTLLGSATLLYAFNAKSYLYIGNDILRDKTQDRRLASQRYTARVGWGQEWLGGISSRIQLSYGKRKFDQAHAIFNQIRKDKELGISLTLWHRNLHFWGITPKISYSYQRVNSNFADLYSYKRNRMYLNFEKTF